MNIDSPARQSVNIIKTIEEASSGQASGIEQIRQGLHQVSDVVQSNAATAEENSATSEKMSAQSAALREEIGKFKLRADLETDFPLLAEMQTAIPRGALALDKDESKGNDSQPQCYTF